MLRRWLLPLFSGLNQFLEKPKKVFLACLVMIFFSLVTDGTLLNLWSLSRNLRKMELKMDEMENRQVVLDAKIRQTKLPSFIERQARERFDLAAKGDLVFVFTESL